MRISVIVMIALTAAITGAFIRSCTPLERNLADAVCGHAATLSSEHCAGCGLIAAGLGLLVIAMSMALGRDWRAAVRVAR